MPAGATAPNASKIFNAASNTGIGRQTVTPTLKLSVPGNARAGSYHSTITVTLQKRAVTMNARRSLAVTNRGARSRRPAVRLLLASLLAMALAILGLPAAGASADTGSTHGTAVLKVGSCHHDDVLQQSRRRPTRT